MDKNDEWGGVYAGTFKADASDVKPAFNSPFDYDAIVGPPPAEETSKFYVLYRYTSSGLKVYKAKHDHKFPQTTLKSQASVCNKAGAFAEAVDREWFIETYD